MRELVGPEVALIGNLPPRDVLAAASPEGVYAATRTMMRETTDHSRIIWSCGGGIPQHVSTGNLQAFVKAVTDYK
jgi:uroporphyrinogen-III decarboxylase